MCARHQTAWAIVACSDCGRFACVDCLVDPRTSTWCRTCNDAPSGAPRVAAGRVVLAVLFAPHRFFKKIPDASVGQALLLTLLAHCVGTTTYQWLWRDLDDSVLDALILGLGASTEVVIYASAVYLFGRMTTPVPFLRTLRCLAYAQLPLVFGIFPWTRVPSKVWCMWLSIFGLHHALRRSWRFVVVGLSLTLVLCALVLELADIADQAVTSDAQSAAISLSVRLTVSSPATRTTTPSSPSRFGCQRNSRPSGEPTVLQSETRSPRITSEAEPLQMA
jgi:hypothetical protein